jgi:hypothetical protein
MSTLKSFQHSNFLVGLTWNLIFGYLLWIYALSFKYEERIEERVKREREMERVEIENKCEKDENQISKRL